MFFTTEFSKSNFLHCRVGNDNEIVRNTSGVVEGLVPTCFAISGYP